jgi:hypothetical protein
MHPMALPRHKPDLGQVSKHLCGHQLEQNPAKFICEIQSSQVRRATVLLISMGLTHVRSARVSKGKEHLEQRSAELLNMPTPNLTS